MALDRDLKTLVTKRVNRKIVGHTSRILRARFAVTAVLAALGLAWWAIAGGGRTSGLYNPGHVTQAHAMFEHDCEKCHVGNGHGGFSKAVSDAACLTCHDGAMHAPGQLTNKDDGAPAKLVMAVMDDKRPNHHQMRSANCAECHTEHGTRLALLGADDSHCTVCHADLAKATSTRKPADSADAASPSSETATRLALARQFEPIKPDVVAFTETSHPQFGRKLLSDVGGGKKRLFDPTRLKFNHYKHLTDTALNVPNSCITCHETAYTPGKVLDPFPPLTQDILPPYATPNGNNDAGDDRQSTDGRYMRPISFDRHCAGCHQKDMQMPDSRDNVYGLDPDDDDGKKYKANSISPQILGSDFPTLRHRPLAEVRDQIAMRVAAKLPTNESDFKVPVGLDPDGKAHAENDPPGYIQPPSWTKRLTGSKLWIARNLTDMARKVDKAAAAQNAMARDVNRPESFDRKTTVLIEDGVSPDQITTDKLVDFYTAATAATTCFRCHELDGEFPAIAPAAGVTRMPLVTAPTGETQASQRWFTGSQFDHSKHTNMNCVDCHSAMSPVNVARIKALPDAKTNEGDTSDKKLPPEQVQENQMRPLALTSYVNSPGITWTEWVSANESKSRSCVECHHPDNRDARGAGVACITCHQFHDRREEMPVGSTGGLPMAGPTTQPTTQPAAVALASPGS